MKLEQSHISDEMLLLDIDGELRRRDEKRVRSHLDVCWTCRSRRAELDRAITEFVGVRNQQFEETLPAADGPRALLKARLHELAANASPSAWLLPLRSLGLLWAAILLLLLTAGVGLFRYETARRAHGVAIVALPDSRLTPGATVLASRVAVCAEPNMRNKPVPVSLRKKVFDEYGMSGADPGAYELDYLVTPALGGADDIHNLWPHSYALTAWNARVKDELEDHLRDLVCEGRLDLSAAQQEIAANWIEAYKKYFRTERPLEQ